MSVALTEITVKGRLGPEIYENTTIIVDRHAADMVTVLITVSTDIRFGMFSTLFCQGDARQRLKFICLRMYNIFYASKSPFKMSRNAILREMRMALKNCGTYLDVL